jgi:photosystem II stability/assembly factor-like uncharacterized protein
VYAGGYGAGLFKTLDDGRTWSRIARFNVTAIAVDPRRTNTVWVGGPEPMGHQVYVSRDGGSRWNAVHVKGLLWTNNFAFNPREPRIMYLSSLFGGIFRSTDRGKTWSPRDNGMPTYFPGDIAMDPLSPSSLYVDQNSGIYWTRDGGRHWHRATTQPSTLGVLSLAPDPAHRGVVFAGTDTGVFESTDMGHTWTRFDPTLGPWQVGPIVLSTNGTRIYAGTGSSGIWGLKRTAAP